jgi:FlgD Ig-like domain
MKQEESNIARPEMKASREIRSSIIGLFLLLSSMISFGQSFDLLSAKASDKVAQSLFFTVDSNRVLNAYKIFSFASPAMKTCDSTFVVGRTQNSVSSVNKADGNAPRDFTLEQNYPNPFNPSTTIRFNVRKKAKVSVVLYDVTGREVSTLVNEERGSGTYDAHWNGISNSGVPVASGTYFYRLLATADDGSKTVETKKMTLIR